MCVWMGLYDSPELARLHLWHKLHVAKRVIVAQIAVKASNVSNKALPVCLRESFNARLRRLSQMREVFRGEVGLEEAEEDR